MGSAEDARLDDDILFFVELGLFGERGVRGDMGSTEDGRLDDDARLLVDDGLRCAFPGDKGSSEEVRREERFLVDPLRGVLSPVGSAEAVRREDGVRLLVDELRGVRGVLGVEGSADAVRLDLLMP